MPIRDRIVWGSSNPFSDPRLLGLDGFVREIRFFRLVLRNGGEVYLTGDHYGDFRQVVNLPR